MEEKKGELGQFYTTNYKYILQGIRIPDWVNRIVEPFTGNGDLVKYIGEDREYVLECYDIDPKKKWIKKQDTLMNPPDYNGKFVITNPPYLARNKSKDKRIFDKYSMNDLYKCFIKSIIDGECIGGILIIPLNFWCSIRESDICLRKMFVEKYYVKRINIFEERVFDDTAYSVCSFKFILRNDKKKKIKGVIYPMKKIIKFNLNEKNNYSIGGKLYNLEVSKGIFVGRVTKKNKDSKGLTNILVKCIDDNKENKIKMSIVKDAKRFIDNTDKSSARSYITLIIKPEISLDKQKKLVENFNKYLEKERKKYNSLFLTNYRESYGGMARKRISFGLVFKITKRLLENE